MYVCSPPRPLAVPKESQVQKCYQVVFGRVLDILEYQLAGTFRPLRTKAMIIERCIAFIITVET